MLFNDVWSQKGHSAFTTEEHLNKFYFDDFWGGLFVLQPKTPVRYHQGSASYITHYTLYNYLVTDLKNSTKKWETNFNCWGQYWWRQMLLLNVDSDQCFATSDEFYTGINSRHHPSQACQLFFNYRTHLSTCNTKAICCFNEICYVNWSFIQNHWKP